MLEDMVRRKTSSAFCWLQEKQRCPGSLKTIILFRLRKVLCTPSKEGQPVSFHRVMDDKKQQLDHVPLVEAAIDARDPPQSISGIIDVYSSACEEDFVQLPIIRGAGC